MSNKVKVKSMEKISHDTDTAIEGLVEIAKMGNKDVLEEIVRRIQDKIYGIAIRMLFFPADAEDATQEILVKIITHLGTFKGESRFDTWVYRIASNHLLSARKSRAERWELTFEKTEQTIEEASHDDNFFIEAEQRLIIEETRIACVHFILLCLTRKHRLAVILGEICKVDSIEGGKIMGISPAAFRQRLSRGRKQLVHFMAKDCSLVNPANPCRCEKLAAYHVKKRHIDPGNLFFVTHPCRSRRNNDTENLVNELNDIERAVAIIRNHPDYAAPEVFVESMKGLIDSGRFRLLEM